MVSEEYLCLRKVKKHLTRTFLTDPIEVTGSLYFRNIFRINWNNSGRIKVDDFRESASF